MRVEFHAGREGVDCAHAPLLESKVARHEPRHATPRYVLVIAALLLTASGCAKVNAWSAAGMDAAVADGGVRDSGTKLPTINVACNAGEVADFDGGALPDSSTINGMRCIPTAEGGTWQVCGPYTPYRCVACGDASVNCAAPIDPDAGADGGFTTDGALCGLDTCDDDAGTKRYNGAAQVVSPIDGAPLATAAGAPCFGYGFKNQFVTPTYNDAGATAPLVCVVAQASAPNFVLEPADGQDSSWCQDLSYCGPFGHCDNSVPSTFRCAAGRAPIPAFDGGSLMNVSCSTAAYIAIDNLGYVMDPTATRGANGLRCAPDSSNSDFKWEHCGPNTYLRCGYCSDQTIACHDSSNAFTKCQPNECEIPAAN